MVLVESVDRVVFKWFKSCWAKLSRCCLISTSSCFAFKSDSAVAKYDLSISSCKFFHSTLWSTSWEVSKTIISMCYKNWISHNQNDNFTIWNTKTCTLLTVYMVDIIKIGLIIRDLIPSRCWCWWRVIVHLWFGVICFSQTAILKMV